MKLKIKNEKLFIRFSRSFSKKTNKGQEQFFKAQSFGKLPKDPDPYYICLDDGKTQFDFLCSEYQQMYYKGDWWGWRLLWVDWKGERWILPHLCKWHKNIPIWVDDEKFNIDLI